MTDDPTSVVRRVIGIDLGSLTCRCAEQASNRRMPTIIRSSSGNEIVPTVVYLPPVGVENRQFGEAAAEMKDISMPHNTVVNLKEWLLKSPNTSRSFPDLIEKGQHCDLFPAQVLGFALRELLKNVPSFVNYLSGEGQGELLSVVLAVPTYYANNDDIKKSIHQAAALCCTKEGSPLRFRVVDESDALSAYFHHLKFESHTENNDETPITVIVNMGHAHTSIVAVKVAKNAIERIATTSIDIGSGCIDQGLCEIVFQKILSEQKRDIKGDIKSFKKVLLACKKAKEILSSIDVTSIQLEGLSQDTDVSMKITKTQVTECAKPVYEAIKLAIDEKIIPKIIREGESTIDKGTIRLECVGNGWRTPIIQTLLQGLFNVERIGMTLDGNLCIAEGSSILGTIEAMALAPESDKKIFDPVHSIDIPLEGSMDVPQTWEAVPEQWRTIEEALAKSDSTFVAASDAFSKLESFVLTTQHLADRCPSIGDNVHTMLRKMLDQVDDLKNEKAPIERINETYSEFERLTNDIPEIKEQREKEAEEERKKDEELTRLSKQRDENSELKTDPQRLRVAQQRREQGTTLFKQECWEEAQTRFVQALGLLGQLYDTQNAANKATKDEIALSCHLNIASCCVKLGRWRIAISNCTSALDISKDHPKALFRRGQAYMALGNFDEALADLNKAKELSKSDAAVIAELEKLHKRIAHDKEREKSMYSKMFAGK